MKPPAYFYGTAWKEQDTQRLTELALESGFRAIDTANQRKHYFEAAVGAALAKNLVPRSELFIQTKFTFLSGQDERLPYDSKASIGVQVEQSFQSSLEHLGLDAVDSLVLHGPSQRTGWHQRDREAWASMEQLYETKKVRHLGVSNVTADQLQILCDEARVRPRFVQNRCYARFEWDLPVRALCATYGLTYQAFSLLTANQQVLGHGDVKALARKKNLLPSQLIFCFARQRGMICLIGTSSSKHMREDLVALRHELTDSELSLIDSIR
jgi:diketogulonate reductase-like aldo/keto reductase